MAQWTVKTYYKKNVQEVETWNRVEGEGTMTIINGFRWSEFDVTTSDDNPPEFEFTHVPGGDGRKDSIDMLNCEVNNIESVELVSMDDGGCWYDIEIDGLEEEEEEALREFLDENSPYELEEREEDPWSQGDTEWWIWGPIEITGEDGYRRVICADDNGNVIDFIEDNE